MNTNKYYRVVKTTCASGDYEYHVEACDTWLQVLFSGWGRYNQKSHTLEEAISHIALLVNGKITKEEIVYKETLKK